MLRLIIIGMLLNLCSWLSLAQGENNYWYLGIPLGVDFNQPTPKFTNMHAFGFAGGGASVCDAQGNLLFYTNGGGIFKADHSLMPGTANFTLEQTGAIVPFTTIGNNDSFSLFYNYFSTDMKIVQLDTSKPRYHIFYMIFENGSNWNIGLGSIPLHNLDKRMPSLAYSIVDMNLNNGQGGIDPNFHNVIVDRQLMRYFDVMTDGQCGVWIMVNKRNTAVWPTTAQEDQGQLLSYLLHQWYYRISKQPNRRLLSITFLSI